MSFISTNPINKTGIGSGTTSYNGINGAIKINPATLNLNPDKTITTSTTDTKTTDKTSYLPLLIFVVIFAFIVYWIMK